MYKTKKYYEADKEYYKLKAKERKLRLRSIVNEVKNVPCMDCGKSYPSYVMDFDHRENKLIEIATLVRNNSSMERLLNEMAKCDVVCSNCHRIRTHDRL